MVLTEIHTQIHLLGPFMDENKAYMILQRLIDSYIEKERKRQIAPTCFLGGAIVMLFM